MTSESWSRVRSLLEASLELPPHQRHAFLDLHCAGDRALRSEIDELLTLETHANSLFAQVAAHLPAAHLLEDVCLGLQKDLQNDVQSDLPSGLENDLPWDFQPLPPDSLTPGSRAGAYRILRLLGEGGMGSVYLAERADAAYSQLVAVKVVQRRFAGPDALQRFVRERQTLARLNHPGIARLLDGGVTEDGRPFLVMEYVEGRPINHFCDQQKLTVRERIALVVRICEAVQSAHQNLIIHRDLKPANILVTAAGDPKLLDFGIAKWLDTAPGQDASTVQILTPSYASPEQACHEPVSTATDVYSLAALLFELLTGSLPHPIAGLPPHEALLRLTATEPGLASDSVLASAADLRRTSPAALRRALQGDLDTILRQALRREPARRYPTAQAFAADLDRYLRQLPVHARPDRLLYRARKFVLRRKAIVAVAALSFLALTLAALGMWRAFAVAQTQRAIAERRYANGRSLVQSYLTEVDRQLEGLPSTAPVRSLIAHRNLEYLDRMTADAQGDLKLQRELAQAYFLIARTQRIMARSLADREQARLNFEKAVHLRRTIFAASADLLDRGQLAYLLSQTGALLVQSGNLRQAVRYHQEACTLAQPIFAASPQGLNYLRAANACWNLATDYSGNEQAPHLGRFAEGLQGQLETLARFRRWRDANPENPMGYPYVASMEAMTAGDLWRMRRYQEAQQHFETALSLLHGPHGMLSHELAIGYLVMADVDYAMLLADLQNVRAALPHAEEALALAHKQSAAQTVPDPGWESMEAFAKVALGRTRALQQKSRAETRAGLSLLESGLATLRDLYSKDPSDAEAAGALVQCDLWALDAERALPGSQRPESIAREAVRLASAALRQDPVDASAAAALQQADRFLAAGTRPLPRSPKP